MHGKDKAMIEIELAPEPGAEKHVFRRVIDRNKGSERGQGRGASTFYVNGRKTKIDQVREIVRSTYNISIDNLCTFLPQDKVGNFSGFTDQQRLTETIKTLTGDGYFHKLHQELISAEEELGDNEENLQALRDKLDKLKRDNERIERELELLQEREKAERQVQLFKQKRVWLEFEAIRNEAQELKEKKAKIKEELKAAKAEIAPLREKHDKLASRQKELEAKHKSLDQNTKRCQKEMDKQISKFENHDDEIESALAELAEIDSKRGRMEAALQEAKERLKDLEEQQEAYPPEEQLVAELSEANNALKSKRKDYDHAKREARTLKVQFRDLEEKAQRLQSKVAKMENDGALRKERILRSDRNLGKIHQWLQANRSLFRRPVWGPIATEVSPKSQNTAAYLEMHVPNNVLRAFVVETKEDYDRLYNTFRKELKVPINVLNVGNKKLDQSRIYSEEKMAVLKRDHGVECYLDETFSAPEKVMIALQDFAGVHKTLVGGEKTQHSIDHNKLLQYLSEPDAALGHQGLRQSCIFAAKREKSYRYTQSVSRYSGKIGSRIDDVSAAKLLAPGVPPEQKQHAEEKLKAAHDQIAELRPTFLESEKAVQMLEASTQKLHANMQATKQARDSLQKFKNKLQRQRLKVEDAKEALEGDDDEEKGKLVKSLMKRVAASISALEVHAEEHCKMMDSTISSAGVTISKNSVANAERAAR
jgi:chromosome segregation ATPase